jgi:hypothetical protein
MQLDASIHKWGYRVLFSPGLKDIGSASRFLNTPKKESLLRVVCQQHLCGQLHDAPRGCFETDSFRFNFKLLNMCCSSAAAVDMLMRRCEAAELNSDLNLSDSLSDGMCDKLPVDKQVTCTFMITRPTDWTPRATLGQNSCQSLGAMPTVCLALCLTQPTIIN